MFALTGLSMPQLCVTCKHLPPCLEQLSVCDSQDFPGGLCFTSKKMEIEQGGLYIETLLWTRLERNLAFHWLGLSYMKTLNCKGNWEM